MQVPEIEFVMLSGGLDSTYLLWHLLSRTELPVHAHHVSMQCGDNMRWKHELEAVKLIYRYLKTNVRDFKMTFSKYVAKETPYRGMDSDIMMVHSIRHAPSDNVAKLVSIHMGALASDFDIPQNKARSEAGININLWDALLASYTATNINPRIHTILRDMKITKREMIEKMPVELYDVTWSCRAPKTYQEPCGTCNPCKYRIAITGKP